MKLFALAFFVVVCAADRLENTYLPPGSAKTAGGNGNFLAAPGNSGFGGPASAYGAPVRGNFGSNYQGNFNGGRNANQDVPILKYNNENNGDGRYRFEYATGNGIQAQEAGQLKSEDTIEVRGSYSYTGDDGVQYTVTYTADENGFQAQGAHLPTPPPIPEAILRALEQNAADEARGEYNDGSYQDSSRNGPYAARQLPNGNGRYNGPTTPSFNNVNSGYQY